MHDDQEVLCILQQLTRKYEEPSSSYDLDGINPDYIAGLSKGIQAFKLPISSIEGKAKLSQNQPMELQERIVRALEQKGYPERQIAALIKENLSQS